MSNDTQGAQITAQAEPAAEQKLWLWRNGDHFLAFDNLYPCFTPGGDPMTLGEPVGYAIFKHSHCRAGKEVEVARRIATTEAEPAALHITAGQMRDALSLAGDDEDSHETELVLSRLPARVSEDGEPMEAGLYAWLADYPEEGCYGPLTTTELAKVSA